ncbi:MAG: nucleotidyltransferase domain-containing protein [Bacteroidota bacterium]
MEKLNNKFVTNGTKDHSFEIGRILIKGENHVRDIAKILNINHMTVSRKVKELVGKNVLDVKKEGRNKKYFLKKSVEARSFVLMEQQYFLIRLVQKHAFLREIFNKIQQDKKVKLAMVFGSYAKGLERKESDVDIFAETKDIEIKKVYSKFDSKLSIKIGGFNLGEDLIKEICKDNILIKGGEIYYEKVFG